MAPDDDVRASAGYAWAQLRRALEAAGDHPDAATRERARAKAERWRLVIDGMATGTLDVGSRAPVAGTPPWVTLEVAHGGFGTGRLLAEQPLTDGETALLRSLGDVPGTTDRERLNLWYLTDDGQAVLADALRSGRFRVDVPEAAALLTVTWLLANERPADALDLVAELRPFLHRLRLTPAAFEAPDRPPAATVRLRTAGEAASSLAAVRVPPQVAAMRTTLGVWHPLFDRLLALWCDTVEGDLPRLEPAATAGGAAVVVGGWPCRTWPPDWAERRAAWLADHRRAITDHTASGRQRRPKSDFARLAAAMARCETGSDGLSGRDVGWIRRAIANTVTRHGAPGSDGRERLRAGQAAVAAAPTHAAVAGVVERRLRAYPADGGVPDLDPVVAPTTGEDGRAVPAGTPVPAHLVAKAARALEAPVDELVARGVIASAEVLAVVLPQISAHVVAADAGDASMSALLRQTYEAFRRRRSLLLLNYANQVRFEELPWVAAVRPARTDGATGTDGAVTARAARQTLAAATMLTWHAFPAVVMPNPLVKELRALAGRTGQSLPLVDELAADIFMGGFTDTWRRAAAVASGLLAGTLYARYYDLPAPGHWDPSPPARKGGLLRRDEPARTTFADACRERAAEARTSGSGSWVAANGSVIEQSQILTTQNLAVLTSAIDAGPRLADAGADLADAALRFVVRRLDRRQADPHSEATTLKNAAYAWRQALFFLSFCDRAAQEQAVVRLHAWTSAARLGPAVGLGPAVDGLAHVVADGRFDATGRTPASVTGRRLLGWSVGPHWLAVTTRDR